MRTSAIHYLLLYFLLKTKTLLIIPNDWFNNFITEHFSQTILVCLCPNSYTSYIPIDTLGGLTINTQMYRLDCSNKVHDTYFKFNVCI